MVKFWSFRQLTIIKRKFRDGSVEKLSMGLVLEIFEPHELFSFSISLALFF